VGWNFGDLFDGCGEVLAADTPALIHGDKIVTWGELTARSNNLARALLERGAVAGDKVAIYMRNCPEYMETLVACCKARLVPVNVNYRYRDDELHYILDNSDAVVAVYGAEFKVHIATLQTRLPDMHWIESGAPYERLVTAGSGAALDIERSGDDLVFIYTGGTTGMPKAVMWRQDDLWHALGAGAGARCNLNVAPESPAQHLENLRNYGRVFIQLVACPLMHGTGLLTSMSSLAGGGALVTLTGQRFDVEELWHTVQRREVNAVVIVGDAFATPMLNALEENIGRWDISSLEVIISSGVMWSPPVKEGLLRHHSDMVLLDAFGSSEALGFGSAVSDGRSNTAVSTSARFAIGPGCKVFNEDFEEVRPGSGARGFIARTGPIPLGYYKDDEKTATTFPTIDGVRYSIPGDWCTVEVDGTLNLLGRGSACINSAGEKIFPEEVEEALKTHAAVDDALVFGVDDKKWGQAVTAIVVFAEGEMAAIGELREHVHQLLAAYKSPKAIYAVDTIFRGENGKADYHAARAYVANLN